MARRRNIPVPFQMPEEDTRPIGALRFADPSTAELPRHIHTFNEPFSPSSHGEQHGVRSTTGRLVPWKDCYPEDTWAAMRKKRGLTEEEKEE